MRLVEMETKIYHSQSPAAAVGVAVVTYPCRHREINGLGRPARTAPQAHCFCTKRDSSRSCWRKKIRNPKLHVLSVGGSPEFFLPFFSSFFSPYPSPCLPPRPSLPRRTVTETRVGDASWFQRGGYVTRPVITPYSVGFHTTTMTTTKTTT